jgi:ATP-dependent protease HslVU (ClpYQ) peptidase subunit
VTCIVALKNHSDIYFGGDSAGIDTDVLEIRSRADEKVFILRHPLRSHQKMIVGFAGSFRIGQLLRYALIIPEHSSKKSDMEYLVTDFIDSVRALQKDKGSMIKTDELEENNADLIVGYHGKIYVIESDFQVGCPIEDFSAIGCGAQAALGAMYATQNSRMKPEDRIKLALEASAEYSSGVRAPFTLLKLEGKQ